MGQTSSALEDIDQQLSLRRKRFLATVEEIRALLRDDLPGYFTREARAAFLAAPEVASKLSDEDLSAFKRAVDERGREAAVELDAALGDEATWLGGPVETETPRTLEDATEVRAVLAKADEALRTLLAEYGLEGSTPPHYHAPVYFVGGRYFPALAEHYWKLRRELADLQADRAAALHAVTREHLVERWEKA